MKENKGRRYPAVSALRLRCELFKLRWKTRNARAVALTALVIFAATIFLLPPLTPSLDLRSIQNLWNDLRERTIILQRPSVTVYEYLSDQERDFRAKRFPTVEERIQVLMGDWYLPPQAVRPECEGRIRFKPIKNRADINSTIQLMLVQEIPWHKASSSSSSSSSQDKIPRVFAVDPQILPARMFFLQNQPLSKCARAQTQDENIMYLYCRDTNATLYANLPRAAKQVPVMIQYGDASESKVQGALQAPLEQYNTQGQSYHAPLWSYPTVPHIKKFRKAWSYSELQQKVQPSNCLATRKALGNRNGQQKQVTQPIVWKLNINRHYNKLLEVPRNDRPWNEKKSAAIFRGRLNGAIKKEDQSRIGMNDKGTCLAISRCLLVYKSQRSRLVDAKLTSVAGRIGEVVDGYNLTAPALSMQKMLQYKALIIVEGNDVSSGLKWALLSNSVVMMPPPRFTSWAMEELLEPWIHYVPLEDNLSNVEERMTWILEHKHETARIVRRATLWILDLIFHPQAKLDEQQVFSGILDRYARHFVLDRELHKSVIAN